MSENINAAVNPDQIMRATKISIAGVTIENGKVTLDEGITLDQASLDFWEAIDRYGKFDRAERKAIADGNRPICNLVWEQARVSVDDVVDYYRVAENGDRSVDGSAPFPVWSRPQTLDARVDSVKIARDFGDQELRATTDFIRGAAYASESIALAIEDAIRESAPATNPTRIEIDSKAHRATLLIRPDVSGDEEYWRIREIIKDALKADAEPPKLLSEDEKKELLSEADVLWKDLEENQLGGYSGINRPFYITAEFKRIIEKYGRRDVGRQWSKHDLEALEPATVTYSPPAEGGNP